MQLGTYPMPVFRIVIDTIIAGLLDVDDESIFRIKTFNVVDSDSLQSFPSQCQSAVDRCHREVWIIFGGNVQWNPPIGVLFELTTVGPELRLVDNQQILESLMLDGDKGVASSVRPRS